MQKRRADRPWLHQGIFFIAALAISVACYPLGLTTLGGALLLSTILVFAVRVVRSGAVSPTGLTGVAVLKAQNLRSIRNAAQFELAKGFGCAGLAVDALLGGNRLMRAYQLYDPISFTLLFTVSWLLAVGALLFLTRWLAASVVMARR
jgi:hypothetical protein